MFRLVLILLKSPGVVPGAFCIPSWLKEQALEEVLEM